MKQVPDLGPGLAGFCQKLEKPFFSMVKTGLTKYFLPAKIGFCRQK